MARRFCCALVAAPILMLAPAAAQAQQQQLDLCNGKGKVTPDSQISACTSLLKSGKFSGSNLAAGYYNRGRAWSGKGDHDRAIADYNEAIRLNPNYAEAYNNRGNAWYHKGDNDRAIAEYNEAIRVAPKYAPAYYNRGLVWRDKGDNDRAIADYNAAIRLDPKVSSGASGYQQVFAVQAVKEYDPAKLSIGDCEFILSYRDASAANKDAAQKVWDAIQKRMDGRAKLPVKIIAVGQDGVDAAITEENRAANKPDLHITRLKQVMRTPAPGDETYVVGTISSYKPRPFLFIMDQGELADMAGPAGNTR